MTQWLGLVHTALVPWGLGTELGLGFPPGLPFNISSALAVFTDSRFWLRRPVNKQTVVITNVTDNHSLTKLTVCLSGVEPETSGLLVLRCSD